VTELFAKQAANPPRTREERIAASTEMWRLLSGSASGSFDEATVREREALRSLAIAALVIHADEGPDPADRPRPRDGRRDPAARFLEIRGMGHDLGPAHTQRVTDASLEHTAR
jgi:hypothetical protein